MAVEPINTTKLVKALEGVDPQAGRALNDAFRHLNRLTDALEGRLAQLEKLSIPDPPDDLSVTELGNVDVTALMGGEGIVGIKVKKHSFLYELRWRQEGEVAWKHILQASNEFSLPSTKNIEAHIRYLPHPFGRWSQWVQVDLESIDDEIVDARAEESSITYQVSGGTVSITWPVWVPPGSNYYWRVYRAQSVDGETEPNADSRLLLTALPILPGTGGIRVGDTSGYITYADRGVVRGTYKYWIDLVYVDQEISSASLWPISVQGDEILQSTTGVLGTRTVVHTCDALTGWSIISGSGTLSIDTYSPAVGSGDLKVKPATAGATLVLRCDITSMSFSKGTLCFWWKRGAENPSKTSAVSIALYNNDTLVQTKTMSPAYADTSWSLYSLDFTPIGSFNNIRFTITWESGRDGANYFDHLYFGVRDASTQGSSIIYQVGDARGQLIPRVPPHIGMFGLTEPFKSLAVRVNATTEWTVPDGEVWRLEHIKMTNAGNTFTINGVTYYSGIVSQFSGVWMGPGDKPKYNRGTAGVGVFYFTKAKLAPDVEFVRRYPVTTSIWFPEHARQVIYLTEDATGDVNISGAHNLGTLRAGTLIQGSNPVTAVTGTVYFTGFIFWLSALTNEF